MNNNTLFLIAQSMTESEFPVCQYDEILDWIAKLNSTIKVDIKKTTLENIKDWHYDKTQGTIHNTSNSFFSVWGLKRYDADGQVIDECPIILQDEIGYLGIISKKINGVMHFLMQAKIEPGNINKIQLSPTIQATKSNFMQKHGGKKPPYLDFFVNSQNYEIVVDQIQSEQSSRFYKKRNRNIIIRLPDELDVEVLPSHKWLTLYQIKHLMRLPNIVNMDTRTVISCIPFCFINNPQHLEYIKSRFQNTALFNSIFKNSDNQEFINTYSDLNNIKMFSDKNQKLCDLYSLENWHFKDGEFVCKQPYPFKMVFCDIEIEGREVKRWTQPLFEAVGIATFGLLIFKDGDTLKFIVKLHEENGCFDTAELAPTIQHEAYFHQNNDCIENLFFQKLQDNDGILFDNLLSEEGGRFYHEQNRNIIIMADKSEIPPALPPQYIACSYNTLNRLALINNVLNIQLRNLLSVLEA